MHEFAEVLNRNSGPDVLIKGRLGGNVLLFRV